MTCDFAPVFFVLTIGKINLEQMRCISQFTFINSSDLHQVLQKANL